jgi:hypothetical protein
VRVDAQNEYSVINQSSAIINSTVRAEFLEKYFDHIIATLPNPEAFDGITVCSSRSPIGKWGS